MNQPRINQSRRIVTELPGPRSKELDARRQAAVAPGVSSVFPLYIDRAEGAILVDVDGFVHDAAFLGVAAIVQLVVAVDHQRRIAVRGKAEKADFRSRALRTAESISGGLPIVLLTLRVRFSLTRSVRSTTVIDSPVLSHY